jgi:hypothetical protein
MSLLHAAVLASPLFLLQWMLVSVSSLHEDMDRLRWLARIYAGLGLLAGCLWLALIIFYHMGPFAEMHFDLSMSLSGLETDGGWRMAETLSESINRSLGSAFLVVHMTASSLMSAAIGMHQQVVWQEAYVD